MQIFALLFFLPHPKLRSSSETANHAHQAYHIMFIQNLLMTCWSCLNGHRASTCQHSTRPLYALKNKGRPRPLSPSRSKDCPDISSLNDPAFPAFHDSIMNDPILRREYFHDHDPAKSPSKRAAPYVKRPRNRSQSEGTPMDIYAGTCSADDIHRWRELCGVLGDVFGDATQELTEFPSWPSIEVYPLPTITMTPTIITTDTLTCPVAPPVEEFPAFQDTTLNDEMSNPLVEDTATVIFSEVSSPVTDMGDYSMHGATDVECPSPELELPVSWEQEMDSLESALDEFIRSELFDDE